MSTAVVSKSAPLPGFTYFRVQHDIYLKCNRCCRAWYRGQYPAGQWPPIGAADRYNLVVHAATHRAQAEAQRLKR
jgi:hypothetical protein